MPGIVATPVLVKRLHLDHRSVASYLKKLAMPVLSIPVPEKGQALFQRTEVAAQLRIPAAKAMTSSRPRVRSIVELPGGAREDLLGADGADQIRCLCLPGYL